MRRRDLLDDPVDGFLQLEKDEDWHFDVPDRDPRTELQRVQVFTNHLAKHAPSIAVFAVPNAGRSSDWERLQRWREGARAGVPDLVVAWKGADGPRVAFMEWKDGKSGPSDKQRAWLNFLHRQGQLCGVFRQPESAVAWLKRQGAPFL